MSRGTTATTTINNNYYQHDINLINHLITLASSHENSDVHNVDICVETDANTDTDFHSGKYKNYSNCGY